MKNLLSSLLLISLSTVLLFTYSCHKDESLTEISTTITTPNLDSKLFGVWESHNFTDFEYHSFSSNGKFVYWVINVGTTVGEPRSGDWWVQDNKLFEVSDDPNRTVDNIEIYIYSFSGDTLLLSEPNSISYTKKYVKQ